MMALTKHSSTSAQSVLNGMRLPLGMKITSAFGKRVLKVPGTNPPRYSETNHVGEDFSTGGREGVEIRATGDARVSVVGGSPTHTWGYFLHLDHGADVEDEFHVLRDDPRKAPFNWKVGDVVKKGQLLGYSGATGLWTTGPHLHYGLKVQGFYLRPSAYLAAPSVAAVGESAPIIDKPVPPRIEDDMFTIIPTPKQGFWLGNGKGNRVEVPVLAHVAMLGRYQRGEAITLEEMSICEGYLRRLDQVPLYRLVKINAPGSKQHNLVSYLGEVTEIRTVNEAEIYNVGRASGNLAPGQKWQDAVEVVTELEYNYAVDRIKATRRAIAAA